ncbi:MAG TPA: winged helix-turn-helix domain-containing protein [Baekduia sp.]|nr:winged helix-turn-helix domain-containing protein [Baekduia sp.]
MIDETAYRAAMHPVRLPILLACSSEARTVDALGLSDTEARWHLHVLEEAGLVTREGDAYRARADWHPLREVLEAIVATGPADVVAD